jgi:aspartyl/glutamyl-tRNA(Asn/Gln) amidotransferase C subunit
MTNPARRKEASSPEFIDEQALLKASEIARLKLSPQELQLLKDDANQVLAYFSQVNELSGHGTPLYHLRPGKAQLRKDVVQKFEGDEQIRTQFPNKTKEGLAKAPKNL